MKSAQKTADVLIRLAKHRVDTIQTMARAAEQTREDLLRRKNNFQDKLAKERALAEQDVNHGQTIVPFQANMMLQMANIDASVAGVDLEIDGLHRELADAIAEKKRYEMLDERRRGREQAARDKHAQSAADETAMLRAIRR